MSYKLIVTDMDGTLLGSDHQITNENKKALIKLLDKRYKCSHSNWKMV